MKKEQYSTRDHFFENINQFDVSFKNTIYDIEEFYKNNKDSYDTNNLYKLKNFINTHEVPKNKSNKIVQIITKNFEKFGKDKDEILDLNDVVQEVLDKFKD